VRTPTATLDTLDALIDALAPSAHTHARDDKQAALPAGAEPEAGNLIRTLHAHSATIHMRDGFADELEAALLHEGGVIVLAEAAANDGAVGGQRHWPSPVLPRRRLLLVPAAAVALVAIGASLWQSPAAQAQVARLASFVPGLGIRSYDPRGLVAPQAVSVSTGGATMTVKSLLSNGETTRVQVEVTGLPATPPLASLLQESSIKTIVLTLRDEHGDTYPPAPQVSMLFGGGGPSQILRMEKVFTGLDPSVRTVDVVLTAPAPVGNWTVRVPMAPLAQSGLPAAVQQNGSVTLHGITVQVASVTADAQRTVIQLTAAGAPPIRFVRALAQPAGARKLVLRDDHGQDYVELPSAGRTVPYDAQRRYVSDALFPPLPASVHSANIVVPFVTVEVPAAANFSIPVAGKGIGDVIPIDVTVPFAGFTVHVTSARIMAQLGGRWLEFHLDLGDWQEGRRLVGPSQVAVEPKEASYFQSQSDGDVNQMTLLRVSYADAAQTVTVTLNGANVAVQGPWRLPVILPSGR
jgi:hypothetical protein